VQAPRRPRRDGKALSVRRRRDAEKTDLRGIWAPAGLDVPHRRAATAKTVGRVPEAQLLLSVSFTSPMIQAVVGGGGGAVGHQGRECDRAWTGSRTRWGSGSGRRREHWRSRGSCSEGRGSVVRVSEGSGWCGVRVSVGSGLDRVGADFRPFRCVGSAQMNGADGPIRDDPWEGRY
jgi:hypothetical protein